MWMLPILSTANDCCCQRYVWQRRTRGSCVRDIYGCWTLTSAVLGLRSVGLQLLFLLLFCILFLMMFLFWCVVAFVCWHRFVGDQGTWPWWFLGVFWDGLLHGLIRLVGLIAIGVFGVMQKCGTSWSRQGGVCHIMIVMVSFVLVVLLWWRIVFCIVGGHASGVVWTVLLFVIFLGGSVMSWWSSGAWGQSLMRRSGARQRKHDQGPFQGPFRSLRWYPAIVTVDGKTSKEMNLGEVKGPHFCSDVALLWYARHLTWVTLPYCFRNSETHLMSFRTASLQYRCAGTHDCDTVDLFIFDHRIHAKQVRLVGFHGC